MKRILSVLTLLTCLLAFCVPAAAEDSADFAGTWVETEGYGTLTIRPDGTATMVYYDGSEMDTTWAMTDDGYRFGDGMWYNSPMELLDENTLSVSDGWMIFAREGFLPTTDEALLLGAEPVGEEGEPYLGQWELVNLIIEDEDVDPALFGMTMTLTFNADGTVVSDDGWEPYTTTWYVDNGFAIIEFDILYIDEENDLLIFDQEGDSMIFARVLTAETDPPAMADPVPVGAEGEAYLGLWTLTSVDIDGMTIDPALFGMTMTLVFHEDGTVEIDEGLGAELYAWAVAENGVYVDGMPLTLDENGCLILEDEDGSKLIFSSGEPASASAPSEEEQLMALLALFSQMEGEELANLPEAHQPFVGDWHLIYVATGGLTGDLRSLGVTGMLTLNADYTGILSGIADEEAAWYEDEDGIIRFGEAGMPMFLIAEDEEETSFFLQYGTEAGGYMIFHLDEEAVWEPGLYPLAGIAPAAESGASAAAGAFLMDVKYVCTSYTTAGFTMDAATLGAEYAVTFHDGGNVDFILAGIAMPGASYTVGEDGTHVIDYYGMLFPCVPTETGFDMDYYGSMMMHFVPAE